jgi:hypothetical protein
VGDERGGRDIQKNRFPEYKEAIEKMDQDLYWALNQEEHQTKIAGTHMALVALEHGVGSCWVSRFDVKGSVAAEPAHTTCRDSGPKLPRRAAKVKSRRRVK